MAGITGLWAQARDICGRLYGGGNGGYGTWFGFDGTTPQVQDDPRRHDYNVDKLVDEFVQHALDQAAHTETNHQMWACGSDFNYQNADHWYHNLDKLIHYVNLNGTVNAFYSNPTIYVRRRRKEGASWEVRYDDIFPLADGPHRYWSGYFTSRPSLKRQVRFASNFLNTARQLEVLSGVTAAEVDTPTTRPSPVVGTSWTDSLEGTIGVATHHDAMSGTERQSVSDDYSQRISESHGEVEQGISLSLQRLSGIDGDLEYCGSLNMSVCDVTAMSKQGFRVVAYNPLAQEEDFLIRLPVVGADWNVKFETSTVPSQTDELDERTLQLPKLYLNSFGMTDKEKAAAEARWRTPRATS